MQSTMVERQEGNRSSMHTTARELAKLDEHTSYATAYQTISVPSKSLCGFIYSDVARLSFTCSSDSHMAANSAASRSIVPARCCRTASGLCW